MVTDEVWQAKARNLIKGQIKLRGFSYKEVVERLEKIGVKETEQNIANKLSRGGFSAVFLLQVMKAIECRNISISED